MITVRAADGEGTKLLESLWQVPEGETAAVFTIELMIEWHCDDQIINMAFHAASSNTANATAACIAALDKHQHSSHHIPHWNTRFRSNCDSMMPHDSLGIHPFQPAHHHHHLPARVAGGSDWWHQCLCCWQSWIYAKWLLGVDNPVVQLQLLKASSNGTDFL